MSQNQKRYSPPIAAGSYGVQNPFQSKRPGMSSNADRGTVSSSAAAMIKGGASSSSSSGAARRDSGERAEYYAGHPAGYGHSMSPPPADPGLSKYHQQSRKDVGSVRSSSSSNYYASSSMGPSMSAGRSGSSSASAAKSVSSYRQQHQYAPSSGSPPVRQPPAPSSRVDPVTMLPPSSSAPRTSSVSPAPVAPVASSSSNTGYQSAYRHLQPSSHGRTARSAAPYDLGGHHHHAPDWDQHHGYNAPYHHHQTHLGGHGAAPSSSSSAAHHHHRSYSAAPRPSEPVRHAFSHNCGTFVDQYGKRSRSSNFCSTAGPSGSGGELIATYRCGAFIGKGGFAEVYEFTNVADPDEVYACKIVDKSIVEKSQSKKRKLMAEIDIHRRMADHKNVVNFLAHFEDRHYHYLLLERLCKDSLLEISQKKKTVQAKCLQQLGLMSSSRTGRLAAAVASHPSNTNNVDPQCFDPVSKQYLKDGQFSTAEMQWVMLELLRGTLHLHERAVIHRDLKLGNVLLDVQGTIKIADFGFAAELLYDGEKKRTMCGTPNYIAPEILRVNKADTVNGGYSFEVDVWALGVILYTMAVGTPPFETKTVENTYSRIKKGEYGFPHSGDMYVSESCKKLIIRMLQANPKMRPSLIEIRQHEFFRFPPAPSAPPPTLVGIDRSLAKRLHKLLAPAATASKPVTSEPLHPPQMPGSAFQTWDPHGSNNTDDKKKTTHADANQMYRDDTLPRSSSQAPVPHAQVHSPSASTRRSSASMQRTPLQELPTTTKETSNDNDALIGDDTVVFGIGSDVARHKAMREAASAAISATTGSASTAAAATTSSNSTACKINNIHDRYKDFANRQRRGANQDEDVSKSESTGGSSNAKTLSGDDSGSGGTTVLEGSSVVVLDDSEQKAASKEDSPKPKIAAAAVKQPTVAQDEIAVTPLASRRAADLQAATPPPLDNDMLIAEVTESIRQSSVKKQREEKEQQEAAVEAALAAAGSPYPFGVTHRPTSVDLRPLPEEHERAATAVADYFMYGNNDEANKNINNNAAYHRAGVVMGRDDTPLSPTFSAGHSSSLQQPPFGQTNSFGRFPSASSFSTSPLHHSQHTATSGASPTFQGHGGSSVSPSPDLTAPQQPAASTTTATRAATNTMFLQKGSATASTHSTTAPSHQPSPVDLAGSATASGFHNTPTMEAYGSVGHFGESSSRVESPVQDQQSAAQPQANEQFDPLAASGRREVPTPTACEVQELIAEGQSMRQQYQQSQQQQRHQQEPRLQNPISYPPPRAFGLEPCKPTPTKQPRIPQSAHDEKPTCHPAATSAEEANIKGVERILMSDSNSSGNSDRVMDQQPSPAPAVPVQQHQNQEQQICDLGGDVDCKLVLPTRSLSSKNANAASMLAQLMRCPVITHVAHFPRYGTAYVSTPMQIDTSILDEDIMVELAEQEQQRGGSYVTSLLLERAQKALMRPGYSNEQHHQQVYHGMIFNDNSKVVHLSGGVAVVDRRSGVDGSSAVSNDSTGSQQTELLNLTDIDPKRGEGLCWYFDRVKDTSRSRSGSENVAFDHMHITQIEEHTATIMTAKNYAEVQQQLMKSNAAGGNGASAGVTFGLKNNAEVFVASHPPNGSSPPSVRSNSLTHRYSSVGSNTQTNLNKKLSILYFVSNRLPKSIVPSRPQQDSGHPDGSEGFVATPAGIHVETLSSGPAFIPSGMSSAFPHASPAKCARLSISIPAATQADKADAKATLRDALLMLSQQQSTSTSRHNSIDVSPIYLKECGGVRLRLRSGPLLNLCSTGYMGQMLQSQFTAVPSFEAKKLSGDDFSRLFNPQNGYDHGTKGDRTIIDFIISAMFTPKQSATSKSSVYPDFFAHCFRFSNGAFQVSLFQHQQQHEPSHRTLFAKLSPVCTVTIASNSRAALVTMTNSVVEHLDANHASLGSRLMDIPTAYSELNLAITQTHNDAASCSTLLFNYALITAINALNGFGYTVRVSN